MTSWDMQNLGSKNKKQKRQPGLKRVALYKQVEFCFFFTIQFTLSLYFFMYSSKTSHRTVPEVAIQLEFVSIL